MQEERDLSDEDAVNLNLAMNTSATEKAHVKKRRSLTSLIIVRLACLLGPFAHAVRSLLQDLAVAVTKSRRLKRRSAL